MTIRHFGMDENFRREIGVAHWVDPHSMEHIFEISWWFGGFEVRV